MLKTLLKVGQTEVKADVLRTFGSISRTPYGVRAMSQNDVWAAMLGEHGALPMPLICLYGHCSYCAHMPELCVIVRPCDPDARIRWVIGRNLPLTTLRV